MFYDKECIDTQSSILGLAEKIVKAGNWGIQMTFVNEDILHQEEGFTLRHVLYSGTAFKIQVVAGEDLQRVEEFKAYVLECNLPGSHLLHVEGMLRRAYPLEKVLQTTACVLRYLSRKILEDMGEE